MFSNTGCDTTLHFCFRRMIVISLSCHASRGSASSGMLTMALGPPYRLPCNNILLEAKLYRSNLHQVGYFHYYVKEENNRDYPAQRSTDISNTID
jgi:hypothetical protein